MLNFEQHAFFMYKITICNADDKKIAKIKNVSFGFILMLLIQQTCFRFIFIFYA